MTEERLDWIERWMTGWNEHFEASKETGTDRLLRNPMEFALSVSVFLGLELVEELRNARD